MRRALLAVSMVMALGSCTRGGFLEAPEGGEAAEKIGGFASDTHFLLEPTSDAESLLGRQVHVTSAGAWTIADARAPGCEVRVKRAGSRYKKKYRVALTDLTAFAGGYADMLRLEARYGRSVEAEYEIENTETLTADTAGPCGEVIVKSVRVGAGFRKLVRSAEAAAKGGAGRGELGAEGGREAATQALDSVEWSDPQAYAFSYARAPQSKQFDFSINLANRFSDGDKVRFEFEASETAYVIVVWLDEQSQGGVLYPSDALPVPTVAPRAKLRLPGAEERQIEARLNDPATPVRETLVVYAFTQRDDFDRFRPESMGVGEGLAYVKALQEAVQQVPISRWARVTETYEIVPRGSE